MLLSTAMLLANLVAFNAPMTLPAAHYLSTSPPNSTNGSVDSNVITVASPIELLITELGTCEALLLNLLGNFLLHNCF